MKLRQMIVLAGFTLASSVSHAAVNLINTESTVGGSHVNRDSRQPSFAPSGSIAASTVNRQVTAHTNAPLPGVVQKEPSKTVEYLAPESIGSSGKGRESMDASASPQEMPQKTTDKVVPEKLKEVWTAHQGESLRQSLGRWSQKAGFRLVWDTRINYSMVANVSFEGSYIVSASKLIEAYQESASPLTVDFYPKQSLTLVKERTAK